MKRGGAIAAQLLLVVGLAGRVEARVAALIVKDAGRVVVSAHDGDRLRWWDTGAGTAPRIQAFKHQNHDCQVFLYEQRLRWTADGRAELLCPARAWRFDGNALSWWDPPRPAASFASGIAPLPGHRIAACTSPTPHGGGDPSCAQYRDAGSASAETCRDAACPERAYGGTFGYHHYLRNHRLLLSVDRLELDDQRSGRRLFFVGDRSAHDYGAVVSPDETLVLTVDAELDVPRRPGVATLWSLRDGKQVKRLPGNVVWGAFSPDSRYLTVFAGAEIRTYALRAFRLVATVRRAVPVSAVAWSDDGRALFVGDEKDEIARVDPGIARR